MPSTCATTSGRRPPIRRRCRSTPTPRTSSPRSSGSARASSWSATAWAACSRSRRPSGCRCPGSSCSASELPRELRDAGPAARAARDPRGLRPKSLIGWETLPERLLRDDRDLTLADVLRIQHLLGAEAARGRRGPAPDAGRRAGRPARSLRRRPRLVIGAGLDRTVPLADSGAAGRMARRGLRAVRGALALRPGRRRDQLPAGRRRRSGRSWRPTDCSRLRSRRSRAGRALVSSDRPGGTARPRGRIRLEAQDTALSRRRSPVRIRYAVPATGCA